MRAQIPGRDDWISTSIPAQGAKQGKGGRGGSGSYYQVRDLEEESPKDCGEKQE